MSDPKGVVTFTARGAERKLVINTNVQCAMEDAWNRGFAAIVLDAFPQLTPEDANDPEKVREAARKMEVRYVRSFLFHGLRPHDEAISINEVGFIMDEIGVERSMELIGDALAVAAPEVDTDEVAEGKDSPPPKSGRKPKS